MPLDLHSLLSALQKLEFPFFFIRDRQLRFTLVSKAAPNLTGRPPSKLLGRNPAEVYDTTTAEILESGDKLILQGHCSTKEQYFDLGDGPKWYRSCKVPVEDDEGNICGLIGTVDDITPYKLMERSLQKQLALMRLVEATSRSFLSATPEDLDHRIESALGRVGRQLNVDRAYLFLFSPEQTRMSNTHEWVSPNVTAEKHNLQNIETSLFPWWCSRIFQGHSIHIPDVSNMPGAAAQEQEILTAQQIRSLIITPLMHDKQAIGFTGFDAVNTCRCWSAEERSILETLADTLSQALYNIKITTELQAAKRAAEEANAAKNRFLINISHDTRTPLNGILGNLSLLSESAISLKQHNLMDASAFDRGAIRLSNSRFRLADTLHAIRDSFLDEAELKHIDFEVVQDADLPEWVTGDERRLRQLMFNLVDNAFKFTSHGRVRLDIHLLPEGRLHPRILLTISDTGSGLDPSLLDALSSPFSQADESRTRLRQGPGIGLFIVRSLIELMQGEFCVDSEPGQGTVAALSIPLRSAENPNHAGYLKSTDPNRPQGGLRILVVEDDPVNMLVTTRFLEQTGCTVICARNGMEALHILKSDRFDCIFMDIQMPELAGIQATRKIRTEALFRNVSETPIIALTAHREQEEKDRCLNAGMNDFLSKPIRSEVLQRKVMEVVGSRTSDRSFP